MNTATNLDILDAEQLGWQDR